MWELPLDVRERDPRVGLGAFCERLLIGHGAQDRHRPPKPGVVAGASREAQDSHVSTVASTALLERDSHLGALREALSEAQQGRGRLVLVAGEAGVGKTALAEAFLTALPGVVRVLQGAC